MQCALLHLQYQEGDYKPFLVETTQVLIYQFVFQSKTFWVLVRALKHFTENEGNGKFKQNKTGFF